MNARFMSGQRRRGGDGSVRDGECATNVRWWCTRARDFIEDDPELRERMPGIRLPKMLPVLRPPIFIGIPRTRDSDHVAPEDGAGFRALRPTLKVRRPRPPSVTR